MIRWSKWLACAWLALLPITANAASLTLLPTPIAVTVGTGFDLSLRIGSLAGAAIGGFDVDVDFDPTQLSFVGATFSPFLGDVALGEVLTDVITGTSTFNVASVSLLSPQALDLLQGDPLLLATLSFQAIAPGASNVLITNAEVSDALASAVTLDAFAPVPVQVLVPEPTALVPLSLALALLLLRRRPQADRAED